MIEASLPIIDRAGCVGCGACVDICPDRILKIAEGGIAEVIGKSCMGCGHCYGICAVEAVSLPFLDCELGLQTIRKEATSAAVGSVSPESLVRLMSNRRSHRQYKTDPVDLAILTDLARIATTAPSGTNCQGWQFVILPERSDVIELARITADFYRKLNSKAANPLYRLFARFFAGDLLGTYYNKYYDTVDRALREWREDGVDRLFHGAPAAIVVCADTRAGCPAEDALLATQNILLAAESMGLATCLIGFVVEAAKRDNRISSLLELASHEHIYSVIACGYPAVFFNRPAGRKRNQPRIIRLSKGIK